jgi:signal transduction histidine kinase
VTGPWAGSDARRLHEGAVALSSVPVERSVLQGLALFRWGAWLWLAGVLAVADRELVRPKLAVVLVALALGVTVYDSVLLRRDHTALLRPAPVLAELAVGAALVLCDGLVFAEGHAFATAQSLGSMWPLAGILAAGVALGPVVAAAAGVVVGLARFGSVVANGASVETTGQVLSLASTVVFYALGGAAAGYLMGLLRRAEREISAARAREEVARTLHDGVLQTLALVERRATDPGLARLARQTERDLRGFLAGAAPPNGGRPDLAGALRLAAARFEDTFGARADVVVAGDLPVLGRAPCEALTGAVTEALTNAGKHGAAKKVTVYVEPAEGGGVFCSVKDDGSGFDPAQAPERMGLARSVRGRLADVGGRADVRSRPGDGTEVCLWAP